MNRKVGLVLLTCATLIGLSVLYFGISSYSAIAEQPGVPEVAMKENPIESEIQRSGVDIGSLAYVPMGNENGLALIDTALHTTVDSIDLAQYGCNVPLRARLNPDGSELYVACENSDNIIVLDTVSFSLVAVIDRPGACQQDIAFVQAGRYALASTGNDSCNEAYDIAVIDTATHTIVQSIPTPGYDVISIAAHPFLPLAYAASYQCCYSGAIMVIDTSTFTIQTTIPFGAIAWGIQPSRDGQWVYASDYYSEQGVIKIDTQTNEIAGSITGLGDLFGLQISPDGTRLYAAGGWSNRVVVLDAVNMTEITTIWVSGRTVEIALTCDGSELYVAQEGSTIPVIDTQTYQVTHNISIPGTNTSYGIAVCPPYVADGAYLSPPTQEGYAEAGETLTYTLQMVNLTGGTDSFDLELLPGNAWGTSLSTDQVGPIADGEMVSFTASVEVPLDAAPGGSDSAVIQATLLTSPTIYTSTAALHTSVFSGELGYVTYEGNNQLSTVDTVLHTTLDTIDLAQYGCNEINEIQDSQLTLDKRYLYVSCRLSDQVLVLDTSDLSLEANIYQPGLNPWATAFTQDGAYAMILSYQGGINIIDTATYAIVQTIPTTGYNRNIIIHPSLPLAYIANGDYAGNGFVLVLDTTDFTIQASIRHGSAVSDVEVSPDGRYAYASEYTATAGIAVIDTQTNAIITVIGGLGDTFDLQISPDGTRLFAAAGWSNAVHVIDAVNFTYLTSVGVGGRTFVIELNADGSELFVGDHTTSLPVIDTSSYTVIDQVQMPTGETNYVTIHPDYVAEGVHLTPAEQLLSGDRGDTLQFVETLSNYTGITDTFNIQLGDSLWPAALSDAALGPLGDGEQITFTVEVTIPLDADWGALSSVLVTATSQISPTVYFDTAVLNSQRILPPPVYLPVALQNFTKCPDFFDDFSDPDSGWFIGEDGTGQAEYLKGAGEYNVLVKPANYYWILKAPTCDQINYSVEVDARWSGNSGASYGLVFGVKGDFEQFYTFEINSDYEQYALYRYGPGGWTEIVPFTYVYRTINPGVMGNHLKVTRHGDTITLEVNGTVLSTWFDEAITGASGSGLIVSSYSDLGEAEARFDNYRVTGLGSAASAVTAVFDDELNGAQAPEGKLYRQGIWR